MAKSLSAIEKEVSCPSIVFKVRHGYYSINSTNISSIMRLPEYQTIPNAPDSITGIFLYRGASIPMLDMRTVFGVPSLQDEYKEFSAMLEARKQDHINWVDTLNRSVEQNEKFTLATDPHKCAFGKWYDSYKPESHIIAHHMRKIDEPHRKLHQAALDIEECNKECHNCDREECLKSVMDRAEKEYMPMVLSLLDEAIILFRSEVYHEMVLILGNQEEQQIGIVVDEVLSVEDLNKISDNHQLEQFQRNGYITGVASSQRIPGMILELDEKKILQFVGALEIN